jgi:replicative DNA helicase
VIPSYENGIPKLLKYRKLPPDTNPSLAKYIREKGSKSILFNGDAISKFDELYLLEGEIDAITLLQAGYENVVGMTGGAGTLLPEWYDKLYTKSKLYLCLDSDSAGQNAAKDVWATRLGISKCWNVQIPVEDNDVNQYFQTHTKDDFDKLLASAKRFSIEGVVTLVDALYQMYDQSKDDSIQKFPTPWESVNKLIGGGFQKKDLIYLSAIPGCGKCVKFDTKIINSRTGAIHTIQEVVESKVLSEIYSKSNKEKLQISAISDYVDSGIQACYRVTLEDGRYIECPDHNKFLSDSKEWIELKYLNKGDGLYVPKTLPVFGSVVIDNDIARFLGYMVSDGGTTQSTLTFSNVDTDILVDMDRICDKFGCKIQQGNPYEVSLSNKNSQTNAPTKLRLILEEYGLSHKYSYEKVLPGVVFTFCKENLSNLISCMWSGDGSAAFYYRKDGYWQANVLYTTTSRILAEQLQHLLLRFGIISSLSERKRYKNYKIGYDVKVHTTSIKRFYESFILSNRKQAMLKYIVNNFNVKYTRCNALNIKDWGIIRKEATRLKIQLSKVLGRHVTYNRPPQYSDLEKLIKSTNSELYKTLYASDFGVVKIKDIEYIGNYRTYDLSVPETECFIANDILIHNTTMGMQLCYHFSKNFNIPTMILCLEMSEIALATKIVQLHKDLSFSEINPSDALIYAMELEGLPIYIGFVSYIKPEVVINTIREARNRYGVQFGVFDNLHALIRSDKESDIATVSKMFKAMTMELDIPYMVISQPRKMNSEADPTYDMMKGSSSLSADGDLVILLHRRRETKDDGTFSLEPRTKVIVDKARLAPGGRTVLNYLGAKARFEEFREGG